MFEFGSLDVDTPKCPILFGFVDTDGGMQLFSRMPASRSSKMLLRPSWAAAYAWDVNEIVFYCLDCDLPGACLI